MGGRGSTSTGGGSGALTIKEVSSASNKENIKAIEALGFTVAPNDAKRILKTLDSEELRQATDALTALEAKFGIAAAGDCGFDARRDRNDGVLAYVSSNVWHPERQKLVLSTKHSAESMKQSVTASAGNWFMNHDTSRFTGVHYIVAHEYGHMVQNRLFANEHKTGGSQLSAAMNHQAEILSIAKTKYGLANSTAAMSRYGGKSPNEFFAEAFANSQCGRPNEIGMAMNDFLHGKRANGLL